LFRAQAQYRAEATSPDGTVSEVLGPLPCDHVEQQRGVREYGQELFAWLFRERIAEALQRAHHLANLPARLQAGRGGLRLRLWLDPESPALHHLWWEALMDPTAPMPLSTAVAFLRRPTTDSGGQPMAEAMKLYVNGIDGETGQYAVPPMTPGQAAALARGNPLDPDLARWLARMWRVASQPNLGLPLGVNAEDVAQAGWGIVFPYGAAAGARKALASLIEHRRKQVGDTRLKVLEYRKDEGRAQWLARHGVAAGNVIPEKVPFYLLLVGCPEKIPFLFGHLLNVEYAVGRLHFDADAEYGRYAASVIDYETSAAVAAAKRAVFFATRHPFDAATQLSADQLVRPLVQGTPATASQPAEPGAAARWGFEVQDLRGAAATKQALASVFAPPAGTRSPAFLFTASHGMVWPRSQRARQLAAQGALLCQDWPGFGGVAPAHYFAAADLPTDTRAHGLVAFHFACYGGGTPTRDRFLHAKNQPPAVIAEAPLVAALPKALLLKGALACIGHVERAWGYSITTARAGPQLVPFQNAVGRILIGQPVGYAMKDFFERYAALSTSLNSTLEEIGFGATVADEDLASLWVERNDAEGYLVLGDPAVHLRAGELT
jgi:hypothetical protein